jgi:GMP synthase-like glutamine amidotransferase
MGRTLVIMNYKDDYPTNEPTNDYIYCLELLDKTNAELYALLNGVGVLVISGGPQHVPDIATYPELTKEIQLLFCAAQRGILVIGICLGFQLINCAFGNPVVRLPAPVIGCGKLDPTTVNTYADPLLECIDFQTLAQGFSFHYDGVPSAPSSDLLVVAKGTNDLIYCVKHWRFPIYGIQSHPEAMLEGILEILERYGVDEIPALPSNETLTAVSTTFFESFGLTNVFN